MRRFRALPSMTATGMATMSREGGQDPIGDFQGRSLYVAVVGGAAVQGKKNPGWYIVAAAFTFGPRSSG